jgi:hypothetical protein
MANEKGNSDGVIRITVPGSRYSTPKDSPPSHEQLTDVLLSISKSLDEIGRRGFVIVNGEKVIRLPVQPSDFAGSLKLYDEKLTEFIRWFDESVRPRQMALSKKGFRISLQKKIDIGSLRLSDYQPLFEKIDRDFDQLLVIVDHFSNRTLGEDAYIKSIDDLSSAVADSIKIIAEKWGYYMVENREWYEELERRNNIKGLAQSSLYSDLKILEDWKAYLEQHSA